MLGVNASSRFYNLAYKLDPDVTLFVNEYNTIENPGGVTATPDPPQKQRGGLSSQKKKKSSCKESELDGIASREQANVVTGLEKSKETVDHENVETGKRDERVRDANMEDDV
ncbi:hypothetical protein F2Q69_00057873 [Brassica cretica]|uniref:Uncharacterized protein n=1 Tax=Brassica cretica TaxID=69181 RepID=A0A8S9NAM9_BRACR|nr:hypothetical protein F2Q69_00057873 [Brassica cretica]